ESAGPSYCSQIRQFFHVAISHLNACKMGFPNHSRVLYLLKLFGNKGQRSVPTPGVYSDNLDALFRQVKCAVSIHSSALHEIFGRPPKSVCAGLDKDNVKRFDFVVDSIELHFYVVNGDPLPISFMPEI